MDSDSFPSTRQDLYVYSIYRTRKHTLYPVSMLDVILSAREADILLS